MEIRELAFSTFLKLLEQTENQKESTLRGFLRGGGFNYWRPLQALAPPVFGGELDLSGIQNEVGKVAKGHQRKYNEHALTNLAKWVARRRVQIRKRPERIMKKFGNTGLYIRIEPEVAFSMDGRDYLMHVWATNSPTLSDETLSAGLYYFKHHFAASSDINWQYLIFDTVKDRIFGELHILSEARSLLAQQRDVLAELWSSVSARLPRKGPDDRPDVGPDDRPTSP